MGNGIGKSIRKHLGRAAYFTNPDRVGKDFVNGVEQTPLFTYPTYFTNELFRRLYGASSVASKTENRVSAFSSFLLELFGPETPVSSLVKLLEMPSVTGHEMHKARYLSSILMTFGIESWLDRRGNVIGLIRGRTKETILYEIHTDVVPPEEGQRVCIRDGRIWGRGSADAQAGIAEILYAARRLSTFSRFYPLRRNLLIVLDSGEEATTADKGFLYFVNSFKKGRIKKLRGLKIWAAVCGEPTADDSGKVCIGVSSAGRALFRTRVAGERSEVPKAYRVHLLGKSCHAAQPWKGANVLQGLRGLAVMLKANGCDICEARAGSLKDGFISPAVTNVVPSHGYVSVSADGVRKTRLRELVRTWGRKNRGFRVLSTEEIIVPSMKDSATLEALEAACKVIRLNNGLPAVNIAGVRARPTCAPTHFSSESGYMLVDFRVVGENKPDWAKKALEEATGKEAQAVFSNEPAYTKNEDFLKMLEGKNTKRVHVFYSHMLSYLQKELGVKRIFVVSGGDRENLHTPDENSDIRMIIKSAHFLYSSLKRLCY
jgi:acetylornithine deacetylase/succinyl-diaminopimelate desuccinylase-like protein